MADKRVSVIMACYNCAKTLNKAIDSILSQTYEDWILICCDDGSTDDTLLILEGYKARYPDKFVVLQNDGNKKLPYSLNHCLQYVETDLVARMDADDWSLPERFERQVTYLNEHPEVDLLGTGMIVSDGKETLSTVIQPTHPLPKDMLRCTCFSHATIMTYKRVYDALNGYSLESYVERCEDQDLWCRFFEKGFVGHNLSDALYAILENNNAVKRRTLRNRLNTAKTLSKGFKRLGLRGFGCFKRSYLQVALYFLPIGIYQKLHVWKLNRDLKRKREE